MQSKFSKGTKGKHNNMADFIKDFENSMVDKVEDLRGKQVS